MKNYLCSRDSVLYFTLTCISVISCNQDKSTIKPLAEIAGVESKDITLLEGVPDITIDLADIQEITLQNPTKVRPSDLVDNYRFVLLETTDESLLDISHQKIYTDDKYIFTFHQFDKDVLQFSADGKFIRKIGAIGRGPGECVDLWDISLDKKNKHICFYDMPSRRLIYFDYNGQLIREEPLYYLFQKIAFGTDYRVHFTNSTDNSHNAPQVDMHALVVTDEEHKPRFRAAPVHPCFRQYRDGYSTRGIEQFSDGLYYKGLLTDTIWKITHDTQKALFTFKFPGKQPRVSQADLGKLKETEFYNKLYKTNTAAYVDDNFQIGSDISFFPIQDNSSKSVFLYDRNSRNTLYVDCEKDKNSSNLCDHVLNMSSGCFVYQDSLFAQLLFPFQLANLLDKSSVTLSEEEKVLFSTFKSDDNPVLFVFKLKDI